jgi:hypothetical protein
MKPLNILGKVASVLMFVCLAACTQESSKPKPESALGDSPTLTGKISNLSEAKLGGKTLTIKARINIFTPSEKILAEGTVAADGSFSLKLPGEAALTDSLVTITEESQKVQCGSTPEFTATVTPTSYKTINLATLELYGDGKLVAALYHANSINLAPPYSEVQYVFVDRDVSMKGVCEFFVNSKTNINEDLRKGWNSVIVGPDAKDSNALDIRNAKPDASFRWFIPVGPTQNLRP